jgi:3-hydroxybutyryl-CoA dehydrogenase
MVSKINTVGVCGAGTMGNGIAQVCALAGYRTILYDVNEEIIFKAKAKIESDLQKLIEKKKLTEKEKLTILERIVFTSNINDCKADLFIEAIIEKMEAKLSLFKQLIAINNSQTFFASNTSSLSITKISDELNNKQLIGLHFFNPAPLMKLVEIIKTEATEETVIQAMILFVKTLDKSPVVCNDSPGFIVNRVARPFYIESLRLLEEDKSSLQTIDHLLEARGFKLGPFKLMDLIGNDVNYAVSTSVYEQLNKPERLRPSAIQKEKVEQGNLGKKTSKGYYEY